MELETETLNVAKHSDEQTDRRVFSDETQEATTLVTRRGKGIKSGRRPTAAADIGYCGEEKFVRAEKKILGPT